MSWCCSDSNMLCCKDCRKACSVMGSMAISCSVFGGIYLHSHNGGIWSVWGLSVVNLSARRCPVIAGHAAGKDSRSSRAVASVSTASLPCPHTHSYRNHKIPRAELIIVAISLLATPTASPFIVAKHRFMTDLRGRSFLISSFNSVAVMLTIASSCSNRSASS